MHNQDIRSFREVYEFWIGSVLIGAEHDRYVSALHAVSQGWHIAMGYSARSHCRLLSLKHRRRIGLRDVDHTNIKTNASGDGSTDIGPNASTAI